MSDLATESSGASGPPGAPAERLLFCAELHGKLGQFDAVISHALAEGLGHVAFGGDLTPNDSARRSRGRSGCRASGDFLDGVE